MTDFAHRFIRKSRQGERAFYAEPQPGELKATDWDGHAWFYSIDADEAEAFRAWFATTFDRTDRDVRVMGEYPYATVEALDDGENDALMAGLDIDDDADMGRHERRLAAWRAGAAVAEAAAL